MRPTQLSFARMLTMPAAAGFPLRRSVLWIGAALACALEGLLGAFSYRQMSTFDGAPVSWQHALRSNLLGALFWIPLAVAIFYWAWRFPLRDGSKAKSLAAHCVGSAVIVGLRALFISGLNPWGEWYPVLPPFSSVLTTSVDHNFFRYWLLVAASHALVFAARIREREAQAARLEVALSQAELHGLKSQLQPHFLFNTLNSISELLHHDADAADAMIVHLGELLRRSLHHARQQLVPLHQERDGLIPYLELEKLRLGDRLSVAWAIEPQALHMAVPHLLLQPLVENAVRHGVWPSAVAARIEISARLEGRRLTLAVSDTGVGLDPRKAAQFGVGLSNIRARLEQLYKAEHAFSLHNLAAGGVSVRIVIPAESVAGA